VDSKAHGIDNIPDWVAWRMMNHGKVGRIPKLIGIHQNSFLCSYWIEASMKNKPRTVRSSELCPGHGEW